MNSIIQFDNLLLLLINSIIRLYNSYSSNIGKRHLLTIKLCVDSESVLINENIGSESTSFNYKSIIVHE